MSLTTIRPLVVAPSAAAAATVVAGGSTWTYGNWAELLTAASGVGSIAGLFFDSAAGANRSYDVDLGVGVSGSEVSLGSPIRICVVSAAGGNFSYMLPTALKDLIASGARVSARTRCSTASASLGVGMYYYTSLDSNAASPTWLTKAAPEAASPVSVTPSGTTWNNSSWGQLTAGLTNDAYLYGITLTYGDTGATDFEIDLGTGGAGSEVVLTTLRGSMTSRNTHLGYLHLPGLKLVAAGTRIAIRVRQTTTNTNVYTFALLYLDGVAATAPPSPATDYPCGIKTPVFWGALSVSGSAIKVAKQPLRDASTYYGGYKPPRLLSLGPVMRQASDWLTGAWQAQSASMRLADTDRYFRNLFDTSNDFIGSTGYLYLLSETTRLAGGNPALIWNGPIYDDPVSEHLTYTVQMYDRISVAFNLFLGDPQIPARFVTYEDFPNTPAIGMGVPIIYGSVTDEGAGTPIGQIEVINVGNLTIGGVTYAAGLICGHACDGGILNAYQDGSVITTWGTDAWAPGKSGWTTIQPSGALYYDINGRRYTLILLSGTKATDFQSGSKPVYVNVDGTEPNGDGTGTVITDLLLQAKHLMVNYLTQSYQSGAYLSPSTFQFYPGSAATTQVVNTTSFDTASTIAATYLGSGFLGAFVLGANGQRQSVRQVIQTINVCCNTMMTLDADSSISIVMLDRRRTQFLGSTRTVTAKYDVLRDPAFAINRNVDWFFNEIKYPFKATYRSDGLPTSSSDSTGPYQVTAESQQDYPSIARRGLKSVTVPFPFIRDTATADTVAAQRLAFAGTPPRIVTWAQSLCGMNFDVLSGVPMTHYGGLSATGWTANGLWITSQSLDPTTCRVTFTAVDVDSLLA